MPARMGDAIVVLVLLVAGAAALLAWHPLGHLPALLLALAGVLVAAGVYRARPPAFPLRGVRPRPRDDAESGEHADGDASTPRPS